MHVENSRTTKWYGGSKIGLKGTIRDQDMAKMAKAKQKELVKSEAKKSEVIEETLKEHETLYKKLAKM